MSKRAISKSSKCHFGFIICHFCDTVTRFLPVPDRFCIHFYIQYKNFIKKIIIIDGSKLNSVELWLYINGISPGTGVKGDTFGFTIFEYSNIFENI